MQPERSLEDGACGVSRDKEWAHKGEICLYAVHAGERTYVRCSEYNAWRLFVQLGLILGASLPARILKGVKL